jgi:type IV secretory pathway TraG/TraD family ATPase VirD4
MLDPMKENADFAPSNYYNPMMEIDLDKPTQAKAIIMAIVSACVIPDKNAKQHFVVNPKTIVAGLLAHVANRFEGDPLRCNISFALDLLNGVHPETGIVDHQNTKMLIAEMLQDNTLGGLPRDAALLIDPRSVASEELSGFMSTVRSSLSWATDPDIREHMTYGSDFSFHQIGHALHIMTVYIVIPFGRMDDQKRWLRSVINVGIEVMRGRVENPKIPTLVVLDEFAQLEGMEMIKTGFVTLRSKNIKLWPFVQNLAQIKAMFGNEWSVFMGNSNTQIYGLGTGDLETSEWLSKSLGRKVDASGRERSLLTPADITAKLSRTSNKQIILPADAADDTENLPMMLERVTHVPIDKNFRDIDKPGVFEKDTRL